MLLTPNRVFAAVNLQLYFSYPNLLRSYRRYIGYFPDIACPHNYNERMIWRKLIDRNPLFITFCDKLATKDFIESICPGLSIPRTLWRGADARDIPDSILNDEVFVKANHGCNFNYEIRGSFDRNNLNHVANSWLRLQWGRKQMEWGYSQVIPTLFVEQAVGCAQDNLLEINLRCSNGRVILGSVTGKSKLPGEWTAYLDPHGFPTNGLHDPPGLMARQIPAHVDISDAFNEAMRFASRLSIGLDFARFDFHWNCSQLYAGEITVYPAAGSKKATHPCVHKMLVSGWDMTYAYFIRTKHVGFRERYSKALSAYLQNQVF